MGRACTLRLGPKWSPESASCNGIRAFQPQCPNHRPPHFSSSSHISVFAYLVPLSDAIVGLVDLLPLGHVVAAVETGELGESVVHLLGIELAE